jgi:hypothetical protein
MAFEPVTTYRYPPRRPEGLEATRDSSGAVRLAWRSEYYSIAGYQIEVDGEGVGVAFEPRAVLRGLAPGTHRLAVREVWYDGTLGTAAAELAYTVSSAP